MRTDDHRRPGAGARVSTARLAALLAALGAIYVVSQFLRNSLGVIAPELSAELDLSPALMGTLASMFFLSFALAQLPLGVAIDRYGARAALLVSLAIAMAGCLLFAVAQSFAGLVAARLLMGIGCSSALMAPLVIYMRWISASRFATVTGFHFGVGNLGTLLATTPLALSAATIGWRTSFLAFAAVIALVTFAAVLVVRNAPPGAAPVAAAPRSLRESFGGLAGLVRIPGFWRIFAIQLLAYSTFVTVLGLWGGPFLTDVLGLGIEARGNALLVLAAAQVVGLFAWGPMDRRLGSRPALVTVGALGTAASLAGLALSGDAGPGVVKVLFVALGFMSGYVSVLIAQGKSLFPPEAAGRGMTLFNIATVGGVFVLQAITGIVIGLFDPVVGPTGAPARPFAAYQAMFACLALALALSWACYRRAPDNP